MVMARRISIVNQKGGVGKTTTSINLSAALAEQGQRVLLVDMDAQGNATSGLGTDTGSIENAVYHVLMGACSARDAIMPSAFTGLDILPATVDLAGATVDLVPVEDREYQLRTALDAVNDDYDYILIDCPPSLGVLTINGIVASDEIIIPVQAEYYALEGLGQLLRTIDLIREHLHDELHILGAVMTMFDRRNKLSQAVFQDIYKHFPDTVFRTIIPRNVRLAEAPSFGKPITEYDGGSTGARAYDKLAREVMLTQAHVNPRSILQQLNQDQENA